MSTDTRRRLLRGSASVLRVLRRASWQQLFELASRAFGFLRFLGWRFQQDECAVWAGALCYNSLLALVPLMAVVFGVISAFPVYDRFSERLKGFVFENFVPATGEVIQSYLDRFVEKATGLSTIGVLFLTLTALLLMFNVELILNRIWRVSTPRTLGRRFLVYWAVLTLGPLLLGASLGITSYIASLPVVEGAAERLGLTSLALRATPFVTSLFAFTLIYVIVPNRAVSWRHAAAGGLLAAVLFEIAKSGFALYVTRFPTYEAIYGAFAAIPIFLIWIYLSWLVTLIGASFAAALPRYDWSGEQRAWPARRELVLVYRLLGHLWDARASGRGLTGKELLEREPHAGSEQVERLLELLAEARLVHAADSGEWHLSRDLAEVTLLDLYRELALPLPPARDKESDRDDQEGEPDARALALDRALAELEPALAAGLGRPLAELLDHRTPAAGG